MVVSAEGDCLGWPFADLELNFGFRGFDASSLDAVGARWSCFLGCVEVDGWSGLGVGSAYSKYGVGEGSVLVLLFRGC